MFETPTNVPLGNVYTQSPYEVAMVIVTVFSAFALTLPPPSCFPSGTVTDSPGAIVAPQFPRRGTLPVRSVLSFA